MVPPPTFLPRLREIASGHGILLVADEVQTGFGRTGELFAVTHTGVVPDILMVAKGIASGLPLGGIVARRDLLARWSPGAHGGTYGGNAVACAAANATLDVIQDQGLVQNARDRGTQLLKALAAVRGRFPRLGDVRGLGLMVGLEFVRPDEGDGRVPDPDLAKRVIAAALERHLIVLSAGTWGQVVRLIPPLVTTPREIDHAVAVLAESMEVAGA